MASLRLKITTRLKGTMIGTWWRRRRWNQQILDVAKISKVVDNYMSEATAEEKQIVIADILDIAKKYRFTADEYFWYHFRDKSEDERKVFLSDLNRIDFCERLNDPKNMSIFNDKLRTYEVFTKYFGRDVCGVSTHLDINRFKAFVQQHKRFIIKPLDSSCGHGICILDWQDCADWEERAKQIISEYPGGFIAEEVIKQVPEMAKLHPQSVNTIRVATVHFDEGGEVIAAFLRIGCGDKIVDNGGSGGLLGTLDLKTGTVLAVADKAGNFYEQHPDTQLPLVGFTVPQWEQAVALAVELSGVVHGNRYAGWDLALSESGWVLVEGNARGQLGGWQIPVQRGCAPQINEILRRLGMREIVK